MNTKKIPAITALSAVLITLLMIGLKRFEMSINRTLTTLFVVLLSFYIIGNIIKMCFDYCINKNETEQGDREEGQEMQLEETEDTGDM